MYQYDRLYAGLSCLAMGDTQAVELAQTCHLGLCLQHGIVSQDNLLGMKLPVPRSKTGCGLVIDDFVSYSIESRSPFEVGQSGTAGAQLADAAHAAYSQVKLIPHEEKAVRDCLRCEMWGALIEGEPGLLRGSLKRAAPLRKIICEVLSIGAVTVGLLEIVAGGLIALFVLRRRLMSLLNIIFREMKGRFQNEAFTICPELREELLLVLGLVTTAVVELRSSYSPKVYMVDASDWGEAVCSTFVGTALSKEISRHALRKGIWTRLLSPSLARERSHGCLSPAEEVPGGPDFCYRAHPLWVKLAKACDFGVEWSRRASKRRHINIGELRAYLKAERLGKIPGHPTRSCVGGDSQVTLGAALKGRSASPSLNQELQQSLPHVIGLGLYNYALYCPTSVNPADHPTRGSDIPPPDEGRPCWWASALEGNFADLDRKASGISYTSEENEMLGMIVAWSPGYLDLFAGKGGVARELARLTGLLLCRLGSLASPRNNRARCGLLGARFLCIRDPLEEAHTVVVAQIELDKNRRAFSFKGQSDPCDGAVWPKRLTAADRAANRAGVILSEVPLVGATTEKLEKRLWEGFLEWIGENCSSQAAASLCEAAVTIAVLLKLYGEHLFSVGAPLSSFRHLITYAQRSYPDFRLHSKVCWEYVTRWELVEPLIHRVPLPVKLCEAMAAVAFSGGKQQHVTIQHPEVVAACETVFGRAKTSEPLSSLSAQTFRRRWDAVLEALHVPKSVNLTPGSVRGGGAVHAYQSGVPVQDLLWKMRIRHVHTLQHYLQEMAAEHVIGHLPGPSKVSVRAASSCLSLFLRAL
ncbi:unnamed protein product [Symbiodinium sp. CCMP2592]|nr:unnamed protein product [Symbiodinium sp. CCMP2592]